VTAIAGLVVMFINSGSWDKEESIMAVTIVAAAVVSILTPSDAATPGP
jgi:hypothetical protein